MQLHLAPMIRVSSGRLNTTESVSIVSTVWKNLLYNNISASI